MKILTSLLLCLTFLVAACTSSQEAAPGAPDPDVIPTEEADSVGPSSVPQRAYLRDACKLPPRWVRLIHRGWRPSESRRFDLILVPQEKNYMGTFTNTSHSGPYDFLQDTPLILYGKGFVEPRGRIDPGREVTLADLAPTYADLMGFDAFPERQGTSLRGFIKPDAGTPKLIVTVSIDGGGWNVLERWPDAWPNIKRLMGRGTNLDGAIVGSSPSITPAVHTTISTGDFPRKHGVTAIAVRDEDGTVVGAYSDRPGHSGIQIDPRKTLEVPTINDLWAVETNGRAQMGMISAGTFPLGMLGMGSAFRDNPRSILAVQRGDEWRTNDDYYRLPDYVNDVGPDQYIEELDRADGMADGKWGDKDISPLDATPAFPPWTVDTAIEIIEREGFGTNDVTDLFWLHLKTPDAAGHKWNMTAPEQEEVLLATDEALSDFVEFLESHLDPSEFLVVITSDHGQTPTDQGGWAASRKEVALDIERHFGTTDPDQRIVERSTATSLFMNRERMQERGIKPEQVAAFLSRYRIKHNIPSGEPTPEGFEDRLNERIFAAAFPGRALPKVAECTDALPKKD